MKPEAQAADAVLMVRPARFGFNDETAASNEFQRPPAAGAAPAEHSLATAEFDGVAHALDAAGVRVVIAADTPVPPKPDAIFPNNWFSSHADGTIVLYPMLAPSRRAERREEIIEQLANDENFRITDTVDLTGFESAGKFLEGTGSLVLDRRARLAYACLSPRTDLDVMAEFARRLDYRLVSFEAFGPDGASIYHTNVMMSVGEGFAVVALAAIRDSERRAALAQRLRDSGHEVIEISLEQMRHFAGNLLHLGGARGALIAISAAAWSRLDAAQRRALERFGGIVPAQIPTIERIGGGSVRCMLAEIHLPKASTIRPVS